MKKKKPEGKPVAGPLPEKRKITFEGKDKEDTIKEYIIPIGVDNIRKEIDDLEHIARVVNINNNTPGIKTITKIVVYNYETKKISKAGYEVKV